MRPCDEWRDEAYGPLHICAHMTEGMGVRVSCLPCNWCSDQFARRSAAENSMAKHAASQRHKKNWDAWWAEHRERMAAGG